MLKAIKYKIFRKYFDYEQYIIKEHVTKCREGYIWRGGMFLGWWEACKHCNWLVYRLNDALKATNLDWEIKAKIKDEIERAKEQRKNKYSEAFHG